MNEFAQAQREHKSDLVSILPIAKAFETVRRDNQEGISNQTMQQRAQFCTIFPARCPSGGACHTCPARVQAKLTINEPGDMYEQEADRAAEQVMQMPEPRVGTAISQQPSAIQRVCPSCEEELQRQAEPEEDEEEETLQAKPLADQITPLVQRQVEPEEEEEEETLQTKQLADQITPLVQRQAEPEEEEESVQTNRNIGTTSEIPPEMTAQIQSLRGRGRPLPASTRAFYEPRFGRDFSKVLIHDDEQAARMAQSTQARAFTLGRHIVFGYGQHNPGSQTGKRLLAHELTHVIQQRGTPSHKHPGRVNTSAQCHRGTGVVQSRLPKPVLPMLQRLPFGIRLPTGMRWLTSGERRIASPVYGSSLNYARILLSNALGGGGRPFTTYLPIPIIGGVTVINIGPSAYSRPGSNRSLLIHELAHSWQSQHHPLPAQFMANSVASQAAAAVAGGNASAYCYKPGKWFGLYAAEQIAQQVENGEAPIVSHVKSTSAGSTDLANVASLAVPRWEVRGTTGVRC